jgi:N-acetylmuramoyl-L-alanine amidase
MRTPLTWRPGSAVKRTVGLCTLVITAAACAPSPQRTSLPATWVSSPNYNERRPNFVVIHHTSNNTAERALRTLTSVRTEVSAHYLIARDGTLYQLIDERARAWHAGESYWGGHTDLNSSSIGIELDNNGEEPFPDAQMNVLLALLADLKQRYKLPAANFLGHGDVAPRRKTDPSRYFPWRTLAERGFGLWCDPPYPPPTVDALVALQALGYEMTDTNAATRAFRRRYRQIDANGALTDEERGLLQCLLERARGASGL